MRNSSTSVESGGSVPLAGQLVRSRARIGLGQDDLAAAVGVSRAMVSYWETGKRRPSDRQLRVLCELLRVPIAVLEGLEEPAPQPDLAGMLLRGLDGDLPGHARAGLNDFVAFLDVYAALAEASDFKLRGMTQSPFVSGTGFESADDARRKAEEVRSHLRLGLGPIGDMDAVCEMLGVTVYRADLGSDLRETVSGAFLHHPKTGFAILVNLAMTPGRRRFTQAHELAHALFHSESPYLVSTSAKTPREKFADAFAGEFLMPTEGIRRIMEEQGFGLKIEDPAEVIHLQRSYGVSYVTALIRLRQMRAISRATFNDFNGIRPVVFARSLGYDVSEEEYHPEPALWRLERFPPRFRRLLRLSVRRGVISVPTAAAMTQLSIDEIADLIATNTARSERGSEERTELEEYEASGVVAVA